MNACPICGARTEEFDRTGVAEGFDCPRHGKFKVSGSVLGSDAYLNSKSAMGGRAGKGQTPDDTGCDTLHHHV